MGWMKPTYEPPPKLVIETVGASLNRLNAIRLRAHADAAELEWHPIVDNAAVLRTIAAMLDAEADALEQASSSGN